MPREHRPPVNVNHFKHFGIGRKGLDQMGRNKKVEVWDLPTFVKNISVTGQVALSGREP